MTPTKKPTTRKTRVKLPPNPFAHEVLELVSKQRTKAKKIEILQENNIVILLAGMLSQKTLGDKYKTQFDNIYPKLAKKFQIPFLPFLLDGVALNPELNLNDGKHPNPKGVNLISKNLEERLIDLLHN